jgi:predicted restriction endonuclease
VLLDAGGRCQAVIDGVRCDVVGASELEAHHVVALRRGGADSPANGVALCRHHHRMAERTA